MSTQLSPLAQTRSESPNQEPQLVLKIAGVSTVYGIGTIKKYIRIGDKGLVIGDAFIIGGINDNEDQLEAIDLDKSSNTISQQLLQDKGGTTSVPSIAISLLDINGKITELITPNKVIEDILGRKAEVFLGYKDTAFPQDFIRIFSGIVDEITAGSTIILNVAHPEQKKRVDIFQQVNTKLTQDLNFRSKKIQKITYQTRRDVVGTVTVTYTGGATAGAELVSVAGNNITVQIQTGVTRAKHIRNAIENSIGALSLVTVKIDSNFAEELQYLQASTPLDSDLTINVVKTTGLLMPVPAQGLRTYVRINDEVIEYTGLTATTITGATREALVTRDARAFGQFHESGDEVTSFYRLEGSAFEMALKVLMSGGPKYFISGVSIKSIVSVESVGDVANAIWFEGFNIQDFAGVVVGDKCAIVGDQAAANNVTGVPIADVIITEFGSYVVLANFDELGNPVSLVPSILSTGTISFASKYNVLPSGAGLELGGDEVDVPEFEKLIATFSSSIFNYDFYLKDTVQGKNFLDTQILFPTGAFSIPKRGKISAGYTSPPLGSSELKILDSTNTTKPQETKIKRSINRYFYNNVLFKFNEAVVDDDLLSGDLEINQTSKNRIKVGNKTLVIEAKGLRPSGDANVIIEILKRRFMDKYKFGGESVEFSAFYGKTFNTDVGDVVVFGDNTLQLPDTKNGSRNFQPRLFEVQNKSLNIKTGEVKISALDSGYSLEDGRYGIISPSSFTSSIGSTTTSIKIKNSFGTEPPRREKYKWTNFFNQKIIVRDNDYNVFAETTLISFSAFDDYLMLIDPALPFTPSENMIVEIAPYQAVLNESSISKRVFVYTNPTVDITATSLNQTSFNVATLDVDKFKVGATVLVRSSDDEWTFVAPETKVTAIAGNLITVNTSLGFTPQLGYQVDLIGFQDGGAPYRFL